MKRELLQNRWEGLCLPEVKTNNSHLYYSHYLLVANIICIYIHSLISISFITIYSITRPMAWSARCLHHCVLQEELLQILSLGRMLNWEQIHWLKIISLMVGSMNDVGIHFVFWDVFDICLREAANRKVNLFYLAELPQHNVYAL